MRAPVISMVAALAMLVAGARAEDVSVWFAPSASKIMRDAAPAPANREWSLAAAKNEVEACQLVLRSDKPVSNVTVSVSAFQHAEGKGSFKPELFRVAYVPAKKERIPFPDPLPPLANPIALQPRQAQPIWISVRVPKDAVAGTYRATAKVEAGISTRELPLSIQVWDFALPDTPACATAFGLGPDHIAERHGVGKDSPEARALHKKYYEFLLDHRMSPMTLPVDLMSNEAAVYLNDPRMTSYCIPYLPADDQLQALVRRLIDGGWFGKGYFYVVDEPASKAAYDQFIAVNERLRKIEPRYRIVAPFWSNPDFDAKLKSKDLMLGRIGIWCPHLDYLGSEPGFREFLKGRENAGESIWWYVCNNPREPYNNLQIDMTAMSHRTLPWQQKREGLRGLLYWSVNYWDKKFVNDPWQDMDTIGTGFYGDGSLLYPGKKVGVDGPVSSLRLEVLRDGLEDFDYLALADRLLGPEATRGHLTKVARTLSDYERDPMKLEQVRRELGAAIERAASQPYNCLLQVAPSSAVAGRDERPMPRLPAPRNCSSLTSTSPQ
jgi:hypothetical protein